ncbi:MAG: 23S rRNA (adenine(1618)-N(6))-methyltransferase RlmF [Lysobacterales bacterium]
MSPSKPGPGARAAHVPGASPSFHRRNRHQGRYDFPRLVADYPALKSFLRARPDGDSSIDFSDADAVRALNSALMQSVYGVVQWTLPSGYLCPPIPGRADYVHGLADLLAHRHGGRIPRGSAIRVLDIGTGASCIYPLLGHSEYGWSFVASDVDAGALAAAAAILKANPTLGAHVELRQQARTEQVFRGLVAEDERFDLVMCNPPFHPSARAVAEESARKWRQLQDRPGLSGRASSRPRLNFGGQGHELWCPGGELGFIQRMSEESLELAARVYWFSTLVSKSAHLPALSNGLRHLGATEIISTPMAQGQKQSRFLAWTFLNEEQARSWRMQRWAELGAS